MHRTFVTLALVFVSFVTPTAHAARTTVAIAPLATSSGQEYQWIGVAIADALSLRVHRQDDLNAVSLRQVNAAMRQGNIAVQDVTTQAIALRLGMEVGADLLLTGSYTAAWPDIEVQLVTYDPKHKKVLNTQSFSADLGEITEVESRAAEILARELGAAQPTVEAGAFGTQSLRAWRATALGLEILNWQSLSPRAADLNMPLALPRAALEKARDWFVTATREDPEYGEAWGGLGVAQALLGQTDAAWKSLGKATALGFGHDPTAVLGASFLRMREGRWDDALAILQSAVERHPGFLHARGYIGEMYNHIGRHKEALAAFEAYAKIAPNHPWVLTQLGYTKSKLGDHASAIADTIAAADLLPDSPAVLIQLASRYIDANKLAGAEDALQHALKLFPNEPKIYVRLGYVYLLQGKDELVIPLSEKALLLAPLAVERRDIGYAHLNLARAHGHQGNLDKAFEHLKKAKEAGVTSFSEVTGDTGLKKLRADPRYSKGGY